MVFFFQYELVQMSFTRTICLIHKKLWMCQYSISEADSIKFETRETKKAKQKVWKWENVTKPSENCYQILYIYWEIVVIWRGINLKRNELFYPAFFKRGGVEQRRCVEREHLHSPADKTHNLCCVEQEKSPNSLGSTGFHLKKRERNTIKRRMVYFAIFISN